MGSFFNAKYGDPKVDGHDLFDQHKLFSWQHESGRDAENSRLLISAYRLNCRYQRGSKFQIHGARDNGIDFSMDNYTTDSSLTSTYIHVWTAAMVKFYLDQEEMPTGMTFIELSQWKETRYRV